MRDLDFISGRFFDCQPPPERRFLLRYFTNDLQRAFLSYYLVFGDHKNFVDHTGHVCSRRLRRELEARYHALIKLHESARRSFSERSLELLEQLESGRLPLTRLRDS